MLKYSTPSTPWAVPKSESWRALAPGMSIFVGMSSFERRIVLSAFCVVCLVDCHTEGVTICVTMRQEICETTGRAGAGDMFDE